MLRSSAGRGGGAGLGRGACGATSPAGARARRGAAASSCEVSSLPNRDAVAPFRVTPTRLLLTSSRCWWGKRKAERPLILMIKIK